jgi:hypothetical protein
MKLEIEIELTSARGIAALIGMSLLAAAVVTELRKPASVRSWHGTLADWIPYDLRLPTVSRVLNRVWAPDDPRVLVSTPFGVGWTINLARLIKPALG